MVTASNKYLIINADDFGLLPEVNQGIIECFRAGSITSATLMVNTKGTADAVNLAREYPALGVGFHFNLTQGRPVEDPQKIPSLVNQNGSFYSRYEFEKRAILGKINRFDIEKEFENQIEKINEFELNITHIDSHHHIHLFPSIFKIVSDYAIKNGMPLRVPWVAFDFIRAPMKFKAVKSLVRKLLLKALILQDSANGLTELVRPDKFLCIYDYIPTPSQIQAKHYIELLASATSGITEVMVHPAHLTTTLRNMFSDSHIKEQELEALRSFSLIKTAEHSRFRVISYREITSC
ncbi:MAG: carbohydrate deacetylase [Candidatus Hodarchaeales archaeon]|jgi:predicted glycoside hydrolase/deacetylase ChbG (UPF0249 family)